MLGSEPISFHVETEYPWDGKMSIGVDCNAPTPMILRLRIPGWCHNYQITLNDETIDYQLDKGYLILSCDWMAGDRISLILEMPIERVYAHPNVVYDSGRVAIQPGPILYCLEETTMVRI